MAKASIEDIVIKMIDKGMIKPIEDAEPEKHNAKNREEIIKTIQALIDVIGIGEPLNFEVTRIDSSLPAALAALESQGSNTSR
jgi:hypothetical protein